MGGGGGGGEGPLQALSGSNQAVRWCLDRNPKSCESVERVMMLFLHEYLMLQQLIPWPALDPNPGPNERARNGKGVFSLLLCMRSSKNVLEVSKHSVGCAGVS